MLVMEGICGVLTLLVAVTRNIPKRRRIAIFLLNFSATLLLVFDRFAYIYRGDTSSLGWWMVRISNFSVFFQSLAILFAFNMYLVELVKPKTTGKKIPFALNLVYLFLLAAVVLLIFSQFTGFYYTFDEMNRYHRSEGMIVCYVFPLFVLIVQIGVIVRNFKTLPKKLRVTILFFAVLPLVATIFQLFFYGLSLTNMTSAGMSIVLYVFAIQEMNEALERAHQLEVEILEQYKTELEQTVQERTSELRLEKERSEHLLLNILPGEIAKELTEHPDRTIAKSYPNATVLFTDIVGFTKMSGSMSAEEVVSMLNLMISRIDERAEREGVEKIKTIGDAYMAAAGLTENSENDGAAKMIRFARGLISDIEEFNEHFNTKLQIRIGINSGPLVAGVIGKIKFIYDIWGDTVNVASRMESTGEPMKIHMSESTHAQIAEAFDWGDGVEVEVKGKGLMKTYYL